MRFAHTTIAVAGTHSTGKSSFLKEVEDRLNAHGLRVGRVVDTAARARAAGFPILRDHVYEGTLWIMAEGLRQEMEAALKSDVVLVDRPPLDALGYFLAALEATGREPDEVRREELKLIALAHQSRYHWFAATILDESVPIGPNRDDDEAFRRLAGETIGKLVRANMARSPWLTITNAASLVNEVVELTLQRHQLQRPQSESPRALEPK